MEFLGEAFTEFSPDRLGKLCEAFVKEHRRYCAEDEEADDHDSQHDELATVFVRDCLIEDALNEKRDRQDRGQLHQDCNENEPDAARICEDGSDWPGRDVARS